MELPGLRPPLQPPVLRPGRRQRFVPEQRVGLPAGHGRPTGQCEPGGPLLRGALLQRRGEGGEGGGRRGGRGVVVVVACFSRRQRRHRFLQRGGLVFFRLPVPVGRLICCCSPFGAFLLNLYFVFLFFCLIRTSSLWILSTERARSTT